MNHVFSLLFILVSVILIAAVFIMAIFAIMARKYWQNQAQSHVNDVLEQSQYRKASPGPLRPNNDFLAKDKVQEKKKQEELNYGVTRYDPKGLMQDRESERGEIVGIAEPVGFWSKFIMSQKLGFILARMNLQKDNKNGYWVNLIKAQDATQGKSQGKGR